MNRNNINFDDKKLKKKVNFTKNKKVFQIDNIDVNKILVSKKEPYGTKNGLKYFIRYNDNDVIRPYIWEKIEKLTRINFERKIVYGDDDKYIKTKIKICADSIVTSFHYKKMPKEKLPCK